MKPKIGITKPKPLSKRKKINKSYLKASKSSAKTKFKTLKYQW